MNLTIRRQWLLVLTMTAVLAVLINSLILSSLINKYFLTYSTENYNNHISQIEQLAASALKDGGITQQQLSVQLESHLDDPIVSIKLYDADGTLVAEAENKPGNGYGMGSAMRKNSEETETYQITDGDTVLGTLNVARYSSLRDSQVSVMFKTSLLQNSLISFAVVFAVLIVIGLFVSRRLSRDLTSTASQALSIDMEGYEAQKPSKVREIRVIQSGLDTLHDRLKIKQIGRKRTVDELVHQTRTPLTILQAHLEGLEDGITTWSDDEIKVFRAQIDNISSIVSNMSMLIDADRPVQELHSEEIDLHALLGQIIDGLKIQFEKKRIDLRILNSQKILIKTDQYKLSQCIYNLITNAYKFTPPDGKVEISYETADANILIHIKDTGIGIAEEDLPHLFDAYYRGHNSAESSGDGLGLYVVKENLEQMGGTIGVQSKPGEGSTFTIALPI
ncbi:MAG TPA: HAMP domain-containing sensor histidine kinase [Clostridiales bacterium]|nr:HAMP domain-containing sensor histidine kinase [Clostridiales bacterium]